MKSTVHNFLAPLVLIGLIWNPVAIAAGETDYGWNMADSARFDFWESHYSLLSLMQQNHSIVELKKSYSSAGEQIEVLTLDIVSDIYGLNLSGSVKFHNEGSLVRILLLDEDNNESLVYEAYPLITSSNSFDLVSVCEETCFTRSMAKPSIKIELIDASVHIESVSVLYSQVLLSVDPVVAQSEIKAIQDVDKIEAINNNIQHKGLKWFAGETSVSKLSYSEKKKLLGVVEDEIINLQGFEYYKSGIFQVFSEQLSAPVGESMFVETFDWRSRHGANKSYSPYYDGDPDGGGWLTAVKDQGGCGSCWAFGATGATEGFVNLFFNQHLDIDLAEQDAVSCSGGGSCSGGVQGVALNHFTNTGVVDENCFPYTATDEPCSNKCSVPTELIRIGGKISPFSSPYHTDQYTEDELKGAIIEHGVVSAGMALMHHAMALVGYKKDQDDGQTIWIFKNSWGKKWGENGYANIKAAIDNFGGTHAILSPVYSKIPYDIHCLDLDGDGYYNWGISKNKPSSCPAIARMEKDCDDANSLLGPYRKDGSCASIQTVYPDVAYNHVNESYLVVYDSLQKIYGKFIDNSGLPMGGEFVISEFSGYQRRPSVVFDGENSRYLVTWTEANEATSSDISGQLVNSDGGLLGDKLSISSALSMQSNAELAFDPSTQTYLVVWQDYRSNVASAYDIYAQRLDANGNRLGTNFVISVDVENPDLKPRYNQVYPYVAYNITTSDFLVTWTDERESVTEDRIYGQLVSNSGTLIGTNFPISDKISENQLHSPVIYDEANRRFVVIWMDNRNRETTSTDIYGQLLDDDVVPIGDNFVISNADAVQDSPDMSYDIKSESVLVVWRDGRNRGLGQTGYGILGNWDIYGQTGTIATDSFIKNGENFVVSDMLGGQISPALSCNTDMSNFMAVFSSYGPGGSTLWDWPEIDVVIVSSKGAIKGDLNNDQKVDMSDYQVLKAALGLCEGDAGYEALADYDGDSCITYSDYREWYVQYKYYQNL